MQYTSKSLESGVWSRESGVASLKSGVWSRESGIRSLESGVGVSVKKGGERSESGFAPNGLQTPDSGLQTSFMDTGHLAKQRVKLNGLLNLAVSVQTGGATLLSRRII